MLALKNALQKNPVVYITRDLERALGLDLATSGYYIISNSTPFAKKAAGNRTNILLIDAGRILDTWELLEHPKAIRFINEGQRAKGECQILVFKNSKKIESICHKNNWPLLNPAADLASQIESKITQLNFLSDLKDIFPPYQVITCQDTRQLNQTMVAQFNHSHTGTGTFLIAAETQLNELKQKFPQREVRVTRYLQGPVFTNNNVAHKDGVLIGNISYQITGLKPFTNNPFATVGNDWGVINKLLAEKQSVEYKALAASVGAALQAKGWKGLFGIDVILEQATGKLYLIEINARQPQSATFESDLQQKIPSTGYGSGITTTTCAAHLAALLNLALKEAQLTPIKNGAQLIDRATNQWHRSESSFMADHNVLNGQGEKIKAQILAARNRQSP